MLTGCWFVVARCIIWVALIFRLARFVRFGLVAFGSLRFFGLLCITGLSLVLLALNFRSC
jgi:hypothetical protein